MHCGPVTVSFDDVTKQSDTMLRETVAGLLSVLLGVSAELAMRGEIDLLPAASRTGYNTRQKAATKKKAGTNRNTNPKKKAAKKKASRKKR